jgi:hypothetical protein
MEAKVEQAANEIKRLGPRPKAVMVGQNRGERIAMSDSERTARGWRDFWVPLSRDRNELTRSAGNFMFDESHAFRGQYCG